LLPAAAIAGPLFFVSLHQLWPLVDADVAVPRGQIVDRAVAAAGRVGLDVAGLPSASELVLDTPSLDYVDREFGRRRTQAWIAGGSPLVRDRVTFKRAGETTGWTVDLHPSGALLGWARRMEDDEPGASVPVERARDLARAAIAEGLDLDPDTYEERAVTTERLVERTDHRFLFERAIVDEPELKERIDVIVAGDRVTRAIRTWPVPPAARRAARAAEAPSRALEVLGFALVALGAGGALWVFLRRLQEDRVRLRRAVLWPLIVFGCLLTTYGLQGAELFASWEPLWPRWVSTLRYLVFRAMYDAWIPVVLLAVVGAGFATDERLGGRRGASLAALGRGRLLDPGVVAASWRGFLVGLLCGGAMAAAVRLLQAGVGARTALQPRGFFLYPLDSSAPAVTTLLFFLGVALAEELGYRFFAGSWLSELGWPRWAAILGPALIYGLSHTRLDFLPPASPFWARPVVLTLVGAVWGWAFFRFDALTVVLSHFTADLFIFNWPRLADGDTATRATLVAVVAVPLLPASAGLARRLLAGGDGGPPTVAGNVPL